MWNLRVLAGGAATIVILAVVAWAILVREAPKPAPPVAAPNEPWPGAAQLAGSWRQLQEQDYREANCRGRDGSFYHLTLEPPKELVPTIVGAMNVRLTRSGGEAACRRFDRRMSYDVSISPGPNSLLEMVMTATSCSEDGKGCPLVDRKIYFRPGPDVLLFGENRLMRVAR
jgi:hypothetical protein